MTHTPRIAARLTDCKADCSIAGAACATQATNSEQFYAVVGGLDPAHSGNRHQPRRLKEFRKTAARAPLHCLNHPDLGTARYGIPEPSTAVWARALQRG